MKTYVRYGRFQEMVLGILAVPVVLAALLLLLANGEDASPILVLLIIFPAVVLGVYWVLEIPVRITIHDDETVEFRGWRRVHRVAAGDIISIKPENRWSLGWVLVRHRNGKIRTHTQFDGFHDFIATLKQLNPSIELRGI